MAKSKKSTKKASVPKSLRKGSLPRPVDEVWAAGIGALVQARKTGSDSFDSLVALGSTVVDKGSGAAKSAVDQVGAAASSLVGTAKGVAGGAVETVSDGVEGVVEGILGRLGVPGRDEVLALRRQVDALQARVTTLLADAAGPADDAPEAEVSVYEVRTHERGWAVQRVGAERASAVHPTKKAALVDARQTARAHAPSVLRVFKTDGEMGEETTYEVA